MSVDERDTLLLEENRLMGPVAAVRTRINRLAPVSKLPFQILEDIFMNFSTSFSTKEIAERSLAWSRVCRDWRNTALNAHRLWGRINISKPSYAHEFLKRSGTAPIYLISDDTVIKPIPFQLPPNRVTAISAEFQLTGLESLFENLGPDLPCLDTLELGLDGPTYTLSLAPPARLKRLVLDGVSLAWDKYTSLTELTYLALHSLSEESFPSMTELFKILEGCPRLEHFEICAVGLESESNFARTITLHNLRQLSLLECELHVNLNILKTITLLHSTRLHINCEQFERLDILEEPLRLAMANKAVHFETFRMNPEEYGVEFFESATTAWAHESSEAIAKIWYTESLHDFLSCFDLRNVTTFELGGDERTSFIAMDDFYDAFGSMTKLTTLRILTNETILDRLNDAREDRPVLWPRLRHITFGRPQKDCRLKIGHYLSIIELAKARRDVGIPLETLEFIRVGALPTRVVGELRELIDQKAVQSVTWRL